MKKLVNKCIRRIIKHVVGSDLEQTMSGGVSGVCEVTEGMPEIVRLAAAEGCVLLKNEGVLPLEKAAKVAVFGRVQFNYFAVGYGSGGDVKTPYIINIMEGLAANGTLQINESLATTYKIWCAQPKNIPDQGYWGHWPRNYDEMPLSNQLVEKAAGESDVALIVIGRAAGEERENELKAGSYYLTKQELKMLDQVTSAFKKVVVILDCGNIIDMSWTLKYGNKISGILLPWQGGMESGNAITDVLTGKVNPSGKLTDTIAKAYEDYPSANYFGGKEWNAYIEDIFVGYRYFETFAPDAVLYPFGHGLSYTQFQLDCLQVSKTEQEIVMRIQVQNSGKRAGKEVVQIYGSAPQGKLGKPAKILVGFGKTQLLQPSESQVVEIHIDRNQFASYDDSGITGYKSAYILEAGEYTLWAGQNIRTCQKVDTFVLDKLIVVEQLTEVMAVKSPNRFKRMVAKIQSGKLQLEKEEVPIVTSSLKQTILEQLPQDMKLTGDLGYKLTDVKKGTITLEQFVAQLSLDELEYISRGEGRMRSDLGQEGNAGAYGGVSQSLRDKGIPPIITADGPAGIRVHRNSSLLPCGTLLACTWDEALIQQLFTQLGDEMLERGVDVILSPGLNIHRNPLCGRNFEYYSEDPFISGKIAAAAVKGIQHHGLSACPKHFACNNQETKRNINDSRVSERALREIYLKGFEIVVKEAAPHNIMTSYNKINGVWSHYNYELNTTVLREEWGYKGVVITDWWMQYAASQEFPDITGNGYRVRAQVDVLMPGSVKPWDKVIVNDGTLLKTYGEKEGITLGEMQRSAINILKYILISSAMERQ